MLASICSKRQAWTVKKDIYKSLHHPPVCKENNLELAHKWGQVRSSPGKKCRGGTLFQGLQVSWHQQSKNNNKQKIPILERTTKKMRESLVTTFRRARMDTNTSLKLQDKENSKRRKNKAFGLTVFWHKNRALTNWWSVIEHWTDCQNWWDCFTKVSGAWKVLLTHTEASGGG